MSDIEELARAAKIFWDAEDDNEWEKVAAFSNACTPELIIALCDELDKAQARVTVLERAIDAIRKAASKGEARRIAIQVSAATAHRACCGTEHDPANGKLHGYCVVCGVPWPCDTAKAFLITK